jgi:hypothetical protein
VQRLLRLCGAILLGGLLLVGSLAVTAATVKFSSRASNRDWSEADRSRLRADMRLAARRIAESTARYRRDLAQVREAARVQAAEIRREAKRVAWEKRQQASRVKAEMSAAMRQWKESVRGRSANRNRI